MTQIIGISNPLNTGRYLGLPSLIGKSKKTVFNFLKDRIWRKVQQWRRKPLSRVGRDIMVKAIGQAIPAYCMIIFLIPTSSLDEMKRMLNSFWWGAKQVGSRGINWLAWDKMCMRKEFGGVGFRDLHGFNLAMLGKQGWRFISNPDTMVSRVFKARYYPRGNFLNANLGHNPSFVRRSIWSSKAILQRGVRWKIGNGHHINVWSEAWLRDSNSMHLETPMNSDLEDLTVNDLLIPDTKTWDNELIEELFTSRGVIEIKNIPLTFNDSPNMWVWHFSKDEKYTVRSAYMVLMERLIRQYTQKVPGDWSRLWQLKIPPKVKMFLWQVCRECLPMRRKLNSRGISVPLSCVICDQDIEHTWHTFITCKYVRECWAHAGILNLLDNLSNTSESFSDFVFKALSVSNETIVGKIAMILWSVWKQRNNKLWNDSIMPADQATISGYSFLCEWIEAKARSQSHAQNQHPQTSVLSGSDEVHWKLPPPMFVKCNIDTTFFKDRRVVGLGMVIRDDKGQFVAARTALSEGLPSIREGEAMRLLEAIHWVTKMSLHRVIFEIDCKGVADAVKVYADDFSEFGVVVGRCRELISQGSQFSISLVRRQANELAHLLARNSCLHLNPSIWHEPPSYLEDRLLYDIAMVY